MYCVDCGADNPPHARFCHKCGAIIHRPSPQQASSTSAPPAAPYASPLPVAGDYGIPLATAAAQAGEHQPSEAAPERTNVVAERMPPIREASNALAPSPSEPRAPSSLEADDGPIATSDDRPRSGVRAVAPYFISTPGGTRGPYALSELRDMLAQGQFTPDSRCRVVGDTEWQRLSDVLAAHPPQRSASVPVPQSKVEVKGWLQFFAIVIRTIAPLFFLFGSIGTWPRLSPAFGVYPDLRPAFLLNLLLGFAIVAAGVVIGVRMKSPKPEHLRHIRIYLLLALAASVVRFLLLRGLSTAPDSITAATPSLTSGLLFFLVWWLYFHFSSRVIATYGVTSKTDLPSQYPLPTALAALLLCVLMMIALPGRSAPSSKAARNAPSSDLQSALVDAARDINRNLPTTSEGVKTVGASAIGRTLVFKYQFVNHVKADLDMVALEEKARAQTRRALCSDPLTRDLLEAGASIRKVYVDALHEHLVSYETTRADCGGITPAP